MSNFSETNANPYRTLCSDIASDLQCERDATRAALWHAETGLDTMYVRDPQQLAILLCDSSPVERQVVRSALEGQRRVVAANKLGITIITKEIAFLNGEVAIAAGTDAGRQRIKDGCDRREPAGTLATSGLRGTFTCGPVY